MKTTKNKKLFLGVIAGLTLFTFSWSLAQIIVVTPKNEREAARDLAKRGIIVNHEDNPNLYNFNKKVLRQEIAAITRGVAKIERAKKCENIFKDLTAFIPNTWACLNVEALVKNNIIARNMFFRPEEFITKAESLGMLIKAIGFDYSYNPNLGTSWQEQIVDFAAKKGIIEKFNDFNAFATRGFIFKIADVKLVEVKEKKQEKSKIKIEDDDFYSSEAELK